MADAPYASLDPYLLDEGRALLISEIGSEAANHLRGPRFTALVRDSRWDDATASLDDLSLADVDDPSALLASSNMHRGMRVPSIGSGRISQERMHHSLPQSSPRRGHHSTSAPMRWAPCSSMPLKPGPPLRRKRW